MVTIHYFYIDFNLQDSSSLNNKIDLFFQNLIKEVEKYSFSLRKNMFINKILENN